MVMTKLYSALMLLLLQQTLSAQKRNNIDTKGLPSNSNPNSIITKEMGVQTAFYDTTVFVYDNAYDGWVKIILKGIDSYNGIILSVKGDTVIKKAVYVKPVFELIETRRYSKSLYKKQAKRAKDCHCHVWINPLEYTHASFIIIDHKEYHLELNPWQSFEIDNNEEELFYKISDL